MLKFQWRGGHTKDSEMGETGGGGDMRELKRRLQEEGVDPAASDDQKLRHIWQLYVKTDASLKGSLASIEELRQQQAEEMREVENYVEHIRSLSDEREALTLEFEAENEQLKADIVRLTNALEGYKSDEIKEMLLQQSLDEIADGTTSEQIAYLLVERARLMDELEAVESRATIETPEGPLTGAQLLELLEQERVEFEEELGQQRESLRGAKETMRRGHEEEITTMMTENEKLQDMLDEAKQQTSRLEQAVSSLREQLSKQEVTITERSSSQMEVETERAAREKAEFEVRQLQCHVQELKADNQTLVESARANHDELTQFRQGREVVEAIRVRHERSLSEKEELVISLQESNQKLTADIRKLELQLQLAEDEAEDLRQQTSGLVPSGDDLQSRLKNEIEDLKTQNAKLKADLASRPSEEESKKISSSSLQEDNRIEDLKASHEREISSFKTKIRSLENKVSNLEGDLVTSQREVWSQQSDFKKRIARLKAESSHDSEEKTLDLRQRRHSDGRIMPYRAELAGYGRKPPSDSSDLSAGEQKLREANEKLKEVSERLQAEKDELFNLLETQRQQNSSLRQELGVNMDRISALEKASYQSQVEREDLNAKLSTALESANQRDTQIESKKVLERRASEERLTEAYVTVDELKQEVQRLNADLARSQVHLQQAESRIHAEKFEYEDEAHGLRSEVDRLHTKHQGELKSISERLEAAYSDVTDLKRKVGDREEEVTRIRNESNLLQSSETKLKIKLDAEQQKRVALELSNTSLSEQSDKAWSQIKELSIKVSSLEATNENLRQELDRKTTNYRETESQLTRRVTEQSLSVDTITRRAETAETKLYDLQRDLEAALTQLQTAEEQLRESATLRSELLSKRDEICLLRDQLQDEKLQKTHATQGTEDLTSQLAILREKERAAVVRSNDLQHMLLDVEAKLDAMKDHTMNTSNIRMQAEAGKKGLLEQVTKMQRELESLQIELSAATERYEIQVQKYNDRKHRTKNKLQKARELFHAERTKCREEVEELTTKLRAAQANSARDSEWKEQLEDTYKKLLIDKRELLSQVAEQEELVHDQNRSLSVLQVRTRYLEEENQNLQSRIDSLSRQKGNLDKLIKEYQLERHKEAIGAMSVDVDALMSPRINNNLTSHVTSLTNQGLGPVTCTSPLVDALVSPRGQSPNTNSDHYLYRPISVYSGMVSMSSQDGDSDGVEL